MDCLYFQVLLIGISMSSFTEPATNGKQLFTPSSGGSCAVVAVHGGAWDIPKDLWPDTIKGVKAAALAAHKVWLFGNSSY